MVQHSHDDTFVDNHSVAPSALLFQIIETAVSKVPTNQVLLEVPFLLKGPTKKKSNNSCGVRLRGCVRILIQDKRCSTVLNIYQ